MQVVSRPAQTRTARARAVKPGADQASTEIVARPGRGGSAGLHTVRLGDVTVTGPRPSDEDIQRDVEASMAALRRALDLAFTVCHVKVGPMPLFDLHRDHTPTPPVTSTWLELAAREHDSP